MTSHICACWPKQPLFALIVKCSFLLVFCAVATFVVLPIACSNNSRCSCQLTGSNINITLSNHGAASLSAASANSVVNEVLTTPSGPEDFAAFGDAVRAVAKLWNMQIRAGVDSQRPVSAKIIRHQLSAALQHLFPFLSSQSRQAFAKSQETETDSKGIVIPCGNHDFHFTLHLVTAGNVHSMLLDTTIPTAKCWLAHAQTKSVLHAVRNVFSLSIPIEVMFAGEHDLDVAKQEAIESLGEHIKTVDILHVFDENIVGLQSGGWAIKPFAILASSFQHVIMADADAVFLQSPEAAFEAPGYQETGTLFFHDRMFDFPGSTPGDNGRHRWWNGVMSGRVPSVNLQNSGFWSNQSIHEMESGVVVINKGNRQALLGLLFAAWMNTKAVREATTYKYTHGEALSYLQHCAATVFELLVSAMQQFPHRAVYCI